MNHAYWDILSRIKDPPVWFDENAVPRYETFTPFDCADIYARECALLRIECQSCRRPFDVAISYDGLTTAYGGQPRPLRELITEHAIHYGDPPNVECCAAGPTMNSIPRRVLEFWSWDRNQLNNGSGGWIRIPALETDIKQDWFTEGTE